MKNVIRIAGSILLGFVIAFVSNMVCIYLLKLESTVSNVLSGAIGIIIAFLLFRLDNKIIYVLRFTFLSWAIGFALGFVYIAIFDPREAQGIFLSLIYTGPIAGVLGLVYALISENIKKQQIA